MKVNSQRNLKKENKPCDLGAHARDHIFRHQVFQRSTKTIDMNFINVQNATKFTKS